MAGNRKRPHNTSAGAPPPSFDTSSKPAMNCFVDWIDCAPLPSCSTCSAPDGSITMSPGRIVNGGPAPSSNTASPLSST